MPDLALSLTAEGIDLQFEGGDLVLSQTLLEMVLVSLFSDGRAPDGTELPDFTGDPRGWWAETLGDEFGSLLWLLSRAKLSTENAVLSQTYAAKSLGWMVEDGIAGEVSVDATIERPTTGAAYVLLTITLTRGSSAAWESAWEATREEDWSATRWRVNLLLR